MIKELFLALFFILKYLFKGVAYAFKGVAWYCRETGEVLKSYPKKGVKIRKDREVL